MAERCLSTMMGASHAHNWVVAALGIVLMGVQSASATPALPIGGLQLVTKPTDLVTIPLKRSAPHQNRFRLDLQPQGLVDAPAALSFTQALGLVPVDADRWQRLTVHKGDTLSSLFHRAGLSASSWRSVLALGGETKRLNHLRPGEHLGFRVSANGQLSNLRYTFERGRTLVIDRANRQLTASVQRTPGTARRMVAHGTVKKSLSNSLARARVPATVANQLASIFKTRNNLARHVHPGATFGILYRARYSGGERVGVGPIIAASITTNGHTYRAFRARNRRGDYGYYDQRGRSFKRFISRHPVNYTHISSPFSLSRVNPVSGRREPHYGVDMAAPTGTPIHAAAAGTIKFKGWEHGYGRIVKINNFGGYSTRYAHMHRFAANLRRGEHVRQGQIIGYVGQTGETTGPHLHFEIRKNGTPHNPMTMKLPDGRRLSSKRLATFKKRIKQLLARINRVSHPVVAQRNESSRAVGCLAHAALDTQLAINSTAALTDSTHFDRLLCVGNNS